MQHENEQLRRELAHAKRQEAATWEYHHTGFHEFTSRARILEDALWRVCREMLPNTMHTAQRMAKMQEPWKTAGEALLAECQKPRKGNKPIDELVQEYAEECCDFSDFDYVRRVSLRYVSTMEDCQVRCLLYVLATWPDLQANAQ